MIKKQKHYELKQQFIFVETLFFFIFFKCLLIKSNLVVFIMKILLTPYLTLCYVCVCVIQLASLVTINELENID